MKKALVGFVVALGATLITAGLAALVGIALKNPPAPLSWIYAFTLMHSKAFGITQWVYLWPAACAMKRRDQIAVATGTVFGGCTCTLLNGVMLFLGAHQG